MTLSILRGACAAGAFLMAPLAWADYGVVTVLHSFDGTEGASPQGALVKGADGAFYGTTYRGVTTDTGTVFRITPDGSFATLHVLSDSEGHGPGTLSQGTDGFFYGATTWGPPSGRLFRVGPDGAFTNLHEFQGPDGSEPEGALVPGVDGALYGITARGGANGTGTIFRLALDGSVTTLHQFGPLDIPLAGNQDGAFPAQLILGDDGNFYGTTTRGGAKAAGSVFQFTPAGALTPLAALSWSSYNPAALVQGDDHALYFATSAGDDGGGIFRLPPGGSAAEVAAFQADQPNHPAGFTKGSDGRLYGVNSYRSPGGNPDAESGMLYALTPDGTLTVLYVFSPFDANGRNTEGAMPHAALLQGDDGDFYGTAASGGAYGRGTVFRLHIVAGQRPAPAGLSLAPGNAQLRLCWDAAAGATAYNVYMGTSPNGEGAAPVVAGVRGRCVAIGGLVNGNRYYFKVASLYFGTPEQLSSEISGTPVDTSVVPAAPAAVVAYPAGDGSLRLCWSQSAGATSYNLYMGTAAGGESGVPVVAGIGGGCAFVGGLSNGMRYYFKVAGVNAGHIGAPSAEASGVPLSASATPAAALGLWIGHADGALRLCWSRSGDASSYNVYQGSTPGGESATPVQTGIGGGCTSIAGLSNGSRYYFKVAAVNGATPVPLSAEISGVPGS